MLACVSDLNGVHFDWQPCFSVPKSGWIDHKVAYSLLNFRKVGVGWQANKAIHPLVIVRTSSARVT